jgi:hypothetical protein
VSQEEQQPRTSRFLPVLVASLVLAGIGLLGLLALFLFTVPTLGPRWLLFFLVTLLFSGLALPVVYYLHLRFPSQPPVSSKVIIREAAGFGIYANILLWLQFGKVLNYALAIFIAIGFVAIELIIRMREQSRFLPRKKTDD